MACDLWRGKIDAYADAELSADEMRRFDTHVHDCASCTSDLIDALKLKQAVRGTGKRFAPSPMLRQRIQEGLPRKKSANWRWNWMAGLAATAAVLVIGFLVLSRWSTSRQEQVFAELADLHVATLASATPVDVVSSDRHTVKPWFQGKLPFTFNIPELVNSPFTLVGGRVSYLAQTPGAHLIFSIGNHRISVFIFQNQLDRRFMAGQGPSRRFTFNVETWSENGLRYFVIGDANADDIHKLSELLKAAERS